MQMDDVTRRRELDRTFGQIFVGNNSAFYGPLMATLNFVWTDKVETSATDYQNIYWNPADFERLSPQERVSSLLHELGHVSRLHGLRQGDRDQKGWNLACDIVINRDLRKDGYTAPEPWFVPDLPEIKATLEEEIYELLNSNKMPNSAMAALSPSKGTGQPGQGHQPGCSCHQLPALTSNQKQAAIQNVVLAVQQAKLAGKPGHIPGDVENILSTFLRPQIPWRQKLNQWFSDKLGVKFTLQRPNRRYLSHGMMIKSRMQDNERLDHLVYAFDVSGSVTDDQVTVFNSELKFIKDVLQPKKMTLILFDTKIRRVIEMTDDEEFKELKVVGRGGTSLTEVRKFIMDKQNEVTAALIFSDLECAPMQAGPKIPIIWVVIDNPHATVPFGDMLHIKVGDLV